MTKYLIKHAVVYFLSSVSTLKNSSDINVIRHIITKIIGTQFYCGSNVLNTLYTMKNRPICAEKSSMCFRKETTKKTIKGKSLFKNPYFQFIYNFLICLDLNYDAKLCINAYHFNGNTTHAIILMSEACLF